MGVLTPPTIPVSVGYWPYWMNRLATAAARLMGSAVPSTPATGGAAASWKESGVAGLTIA